MPTIVELTSQLVASQASTTSMSVEEILTALDRIHAKLTQLETGVAGPAAEQQPPAPEH